MSDTSQRPPRRAATTPRRLLGGRSRVESEPVPDVHESKRHKAAKKIIDLISMPFAGIALFKQIQNPDVIPPLALDLQTVEHHKDALAGGIEGLAEKFPVVGLLLDRFDDDVASLFSVGLMIGAQVLENHGRLPAGVERVIPVIPRDELAQQMMADAEKVAAQMSENGSEQ